MPIIAGVVIIAIVVAIIINNKKRAKETSDLKMLIKQQGAISKKLSTPNSVKQLGGPTGPGLPTNNGGRGPAPGNMPMGGPGPGNMPMGGPGPAPKGPVPSPRPGAAAAQRPGVQRPAGPVPPKIEVNAPPKSLAPKRK